MFGRHDADADLTTGSFALIAGFTGSHDATKRAQVWDYISSRFGVSTEPTTDYAFTSGTLPYTENDFFVIPSASIDPRFFSNGHMKFRMIVGDGIYTNTITIFSLASDSTNQRLIVTTGGSWRYYYQESTFITICTTINTDSGLPIVAGDEIEIYVDQNRGMFGIVNLTKNTAYNQAVATTTSSIAYGDINWLSANGTTAGLAGTGWQVYPPDFGVGWE